MWQYDSHKTGSAKTYVALAEDRLVGYYALATGSVQKHESPERIAKGLSNHPSGAVLLARLAVDHTQQGKGLGKALLFDEHFNFEPSPIDPFQLMLLLKDLRKALQ